LLTVLEFISLMQHAIGRTPAPGHNLRQTFNRAGRRLVDQFEWSWKTPAPVNLTVLAGDVGNDFIRLDAAHGVTTFTHLTSMRAGNRDVQMLLPAELLAIKQSGYNPYSGLVASILTDVVPTALGSTLPVPRLWLVDPLVTADIGRTIGTMLYRRGWQDVATAGTADDAKVPPIPDSWEDALVCLSRGMAYALEFNTEHPDMARYANAVQDLIARDTTRQTHFGIVGGGFGDIPSPQPGMQGFGPIIITGAP
jgi:hypothetical protein